MSGKHMLCCLISNNFTGLMFILWNLWLEQIQTMGCVHCVPKHYFSSLNNQFSVLKANFQHRIAKISNGYCSCSCVLTTYLWTLYVSEDIKLAFTYLSQQNSKGASLVSCRPNNLALMYLSKCSSLFALEASGGPAVSCQDVQAPSWMLCVHWSVTQAPYKDEGIKLNKWHHNFIKAIEI